MFEFILPDLGEGIHEGELLAWHVNKGDMVKEDDPLCDMETDKATVTIPCPRTGEVTELNGSPGDIIHVGEVLAVIRETDQESSRAPGEPSGQTEKQAEKEVSSASPPEKGLIPPVPNFSGSKPKVAAAPATRRLAREMGVDITRVSGTGAGGKVTPEDVKAFADSTESGSAEMPEVPLQSPATENDTTEVPAAVDGIPFLSIDPLPDFSAAGPVEMIPIRSLRKKVAAKTTTSSIVIPHVAHMEEWDVTRLEKLRKEINSRGEQKLTLLSFVMKAAASLLYQYPEFNASVDIKNLQIIHKKYMHIGFAADTPKGLMVPVVKDADKKSVVMIAKKIRDLSSQGQEGSIDAKDLSGSTFTITNVGVIGGTGVFPIINHPESAILGMGRVAKKPVVVEDEIKIRAMLPATLCFDHRVADGVRAAKFMRDLKSMIEDPGVYLTHV